MILDVKMPVLDGISAAEKIAEESIAPVLMLTAFSQRDLVERARDAGGAMAYLVKPFSKSDVVPAIEMAVSRFSELKALENEVADLAQRLETRKLVDRAKSILQTDYGLSEPEAFRWIQKTSMDRRLSMQQLAEALIADARRRRRPPSRPRKAQERPAPPSAGLSRVCVLRVSPRPGTPCGRTRRGGGPLRCRRGRSCRSP